MKSALLGSLIVAAASPACIVEKTTGHDDSNAIVNVTWSLRSIAGIEAMCPAGTTTAQVIAQPIDPTAGTPEGSPTTALFDCDAKSGTIQLDPESYILSVRLQNADGSVIYADSLASRQLDLTVEDTSQNFDIYTDGGYLSLSWNFVDKNDGVLDCETGDISDVRVVLTPAGGGSAIATDPIPCIDFSATTSVIPAGMYSLAVNAEQSGATIGTFALAAATIMAPNKVAGLGTITIPIHTN